MCAAALAETEPEKLQPQLTVWSGPLAHLPSCLDGLGICVSAPKWLQRDLGSRPSKAGTVMVAGTCPPAAAAVGRAVTRGLEGENPCLEMLLRALPAAREAGAGRDSLAVISDSAPSPLLANMKRCFTARRRESVSQVSSRREPPGRIERRCRPRIERRSAIGSHCTDAKSAVCILYFRNCLCDHFAPGSGARLGRSPWLQQPKRSGMRRSSIGRSTHRRSAGACPMSCEGQQAFSQEEAGTLALEQCSAKFYTLQATVEAMMLDSKASVIDKEERPEVRHRHSAAGD